MNEQTEIKIEELVYKSLEGIITEQECRELEMMLASDPEASEYYVSSIEFNNRILKIKDSINKPLQMMMAFEELAEYEKTAPEIEFIQSQHQPELIQKVVYPTREKRKLSKFSIFMLLNAAAIVLFFLYLKFAPPTSGIEVATLSDSINAKWADLDMSMHKGTRLTTGNERLLLREGFVELLFDTNTRVVIEGPAEFQILADDRIGLKYGRAYSSVPKETIGFSIYTENAKVIDLGTEFAVEADFKGNTQLHVIDGKTVLIARGQSDKKGITVGQGAAKKIAADSADITDIACDYDNFVRNIDSEAGFLWRGENLSLASIVAGRDGFQEVGSLVGLDPVKGEFVTSIMAIDEYWRSNNAYNLVPGLQFIDGVFVPGSESGPNQITSLGHTFNCPNTSGKYTHGIAAYKGSIKNQQTTIPPVIINNQEIVNDPILMLHSNAGITFDLQAIRQSLPQLDLKGLKATGIPMQEFTVQDFDFWVLIDSKIKYERKVVTSNRERDPIPFYVEIGPKDRFLTLIITDGLRATDDEREYPYANDFIYLINPELCLTDRSGR